MRVILTGGGSGGHVTPLRAVAEALKAQDSAIEVWFVGQRGDRFASVMATPAIDKQKLIWAGKFRRYANESWLQKLIDVTTNLKNLMDVFKIALGGLQATALMLRLRPDVILSKSGPTSLAVLLAGRLSGARLITYDSDAIAGLAHKLVGNWADLHLVGQSSGRYPYHDAKIEVVGVPINAVFDTPATPDEVAQAKQALDVTDKTLVFVFAGSLGSTAINQAIMAVAPHLPDTYQVILVAGHNHATKLAAQLKEAGLAARVSIKDYINGPEAIRQHYAAADVVVARAGATTTAEIAAMAKPAIIIPASQLSDQLVNAKQLAKNQAAIVLSDETITSQPNQLTEAINKLTQTDAGQHCAKQLHGLYVPQAAQKIAQHVIKSNG